MLVKNVSARLHHVGAVSIAPGEEKEIGDEYASAINPAELIAVETPVKRGRPAKPVADDADTKED